MVPCAAHTVPWYSLAWSVTPRVVCNKMSPNRRRNPLTLRDRALGYARARASAFVNSRRRKGNVASGHQPRVPVAERKAPSLQLRWQRDKTHRYNISDDGTQLTRVAGLEPWAAGTPLPVWGTFSFVVHVEQATSAGRFCIGVCDEECSVAWGLHLQSGRLLRVTRDGDGKVRNALGAADKNGSRIATERSSCMAIECIIDADGGNLKFRINGGPERHALSNLPQSTRLRPWARLVQRGDTVRLEPGFGWMPAPSRTGSLLACMPTTGRL